MPGRYCPKCNTVFTLATGVCTNHPGPVPVALDKGTRITGLGTTFEVEYLGAGAMGVTYKATDNTTRRTVVLKELLPVNDPDEQKDRVRRFHREAEVQKFLSDGYPNVDLPFPRGFGHFIDATAGREFMAMEFIPGQDLTKLLTTRGTLDRLLAIQVGIEVCLALKYLHDFVDPVTKRPDAVVHRDLKPDNIMAKPTAGGLSFLILDFGIARKAVKSAATVALGPQGTMAGTGEYWAPEQVGAFGGNIDARTDIYALGGTMYHLITGQKLPIVVAQRQQLIAANVTNPELQAVIRQAMQNNPAARFQTADEMLTELVQLYEAVTPLPNHLQRLIHPAQAAAPPPPPPVVRPTPIVTGPPVSIEWPPNMRPAYVVKPSTAVPPKEYHQDIEGTVMRGTQPVSQVNVIPMITNETGPGGPGTQVPTDASGHFQLDWADTTVSINSGWRRIRLVVEDARGNHLYHEEVVINRPAGATLQRAGLSVVSTLLTPVRAPGVWWRNRQLNRAALIQAKAQAKAARVQAKVQAFQARQQAKLANAQARQQAAAAKAQAKAQARAARAARLKAWFATLSTANLFVALTVALVVAMLFGIAQHWTAVWTLTPWLAFVSGRAASLARRGKLPKSWKWAVFPRLSTVYLGIWLIAMLYSR